MQVTQTTHTYVNDASSNHSSQGSEFTSDDVDMFESIASSVNINEATKRCTLAEKFNLTHFKPFQSNIIDAVMQKKDTLVVQPTGSGKSLCFQFPAVHTGKISLVITPTISLMQDQTYELQKNNISAMYLGSAQIDPCAESKVFSPDSNVLLLFVSPEWLFGNDDKNLLKVQR